MLIGSKRWLQTVRGRPWFGYLNFQANHFPYEVPPEAPRPFAPWRIDFAASFFSYPAEKAPVFVNRFNNALAYSDRWIGELRAELERTGQWQRTALVVVSDHGEAFYDHRLAAHRRLQPDRRGVDDDRVCQLHQRIGARRVCTRSSCAR